MVPAWLIGKVGQRLAAPLFYGGIILIALIIAFTLGRCGKEDDTVQKQIDQSNANAEAFGEAVEGAVDIIDNRNINDATVDNAVEQVKDKIGNAKSPVAIRDAVLDSLCRKPSHRDDPACTMRPPDSG